MPEAGFLAQRRRSPTGFALIVLAHAGLIGAVMLAKGPEIVEAFTRTRIIQVDLEKPPPAEPRKQPDRPQRPRQHYTAPPLPPIQPPTSGPETQADDRPPLPPLDPPGVGTTSRPPADPPVPPPVRREAEYDQRYADALQPPYPGSEERAQRGGTVRVRVTIGANGRVLAVARLAATSDAFWTATRSHALARWRFKPATVDGRPVESTKVLNIRFRIEDL